MQVGWIKVKDPIYIRTSIWDDPVVVERWDAGR